MPESKSGLTLDRDINSYLKAWKVPETDKTAFHKVTLRYLLSQKSGFTYGKYMGYDREKPIPTLLQVLQGVEPSATPPATVATVPGETFALAMENFAVLQQITEDATGQPFEKVMRGLLFSPLSMRHSKFMVAPSAKDTRAAVGHDDDGELLPGKWRAYPEVAASGLWATPAEFAGAIAEMLQCLRGEGRYLTQATAHILDKEIAKDKTDEDGQGMGFGRTVQNGVPILFRGGNAEGYYVQFTETRQRAMPALCSPTAICAGN